MASVGEPQFRFCHSPGRRARGDRRGPAIATGDGRQLARRDHSRGYSCRAGTTDACRTAGAGAARCTTRCRRCRTQRGRVARAIGPSRSSRHRCSASTAASVATRRRWERRPARRRCPRVGFALCRLSDHERNPDTRHQRIVVLANEPDQFVSALIDADIGTGAWNVKFPPRGTPPRRRTARIANFAGSAAACTRSFAGRSKPRACITARKITNAPGHPPAVDVYIEDCGRARANAIRRRPVWAGQLLSGLSRLGSRSGPSGCAAGVASRPRRHRGEWQRHFRARSAIAARNRPPTWKSRVLVSRMACRREPPQWNKGPWKTVHPSQPRVTIETVDPRSSDTLRSVRPHRAPGGRYLVLAIATCGDDRANRTATWFACSLAAHAARRPGGQRQQSRSARDRLALMTGLVIRSPFGRPFGARGRSTVSSVGQPMRYSGVRLVQQRAPDRGGKVAARVQNPRHSGRRCARGSWPTAGQAKAAAIGSRRCPAAGCA